MALRVVAMGDRNAVDIAQETHEAILRGYGCMLPSQALVYGRCLPSSKTMEGVYIDDHLTVSITKKADAKKREGRDWDLIQASHRAYEASGLPRAEDKAFGFARTKAGGSRAGGP